MAKKKKKSNKSKTIALTAAPDTVKSLAKPSYVSTKSNNKLTFKVSWKARDKQFDKKSNKRTEWIDGVWTLGFKTEYMLAATDERKRRKAAMTAAEKKTVHVTPATSIAWYYISKGKKVKGAQGPKNVGGVRKIAMHKAPSNVTNLNQIVMRNAFYPFKRTSRVKTKSGTYNSYRFLTSMSFTIYSKNTFKGSSSSKAVTQTLKISPPDDPKIGGVSLDGNTRKWSCTITAAADKPSKERYDTYYWVEKKQNFKAASSDKKYYNKWATLISPTSKTGDTINLSGSLPDLDAIGYSGYIGICIYAYSRGLAGRSGAKKTLYKTRYFSYPNQPVISGIDVQRDNKSIASSGRIVVHVSSKASTTHPTDKMTLEILKNSVITDAEEAMASDSWTEVGTSGIGSTTAFADTLVNAYPDNGRKVWYRVRSEHDHLIRYSKPFRATALEHGVGNAAIVDATVVDDGVNPTGIKVIMGLSGKSTGAEVEWSTNKNAINSNNPPSTYKQPYLYSKATTKDINKKYRQNYPYSTCFYITGLEEGAKYYIAARRYNEGSSGTEYGDRSYWKSSKDVRAVLFARKPTNIKLTVPAYIDETSSSFEVSWIFDSVIRQKSFKLYAITAKRDSNGNIVYKGGKAESVMNVVTSANTERMYCAVPVSSIKRFVENGNLVLRVAVSCGGPEAMSSNSSAIAVVRKPNVQLDISEAAPNGILVEQGLKAKYTVDQTGVKVLLTIVSTGVVVAYPNGDYAQADGEVVYTGVLTPSAANTAIEYTLPNCDFLDGGRYTISATPVGRTGLRGPTQEVTLRVDWAHQAHVAGSLTRAVGDNSGLTATIHTERPDNWVFGDKFDLYRVTPDGAYLIAEDRDFGLDVVDRFAPFSKRANLRYRVVTTTSDGDVDWVDIPYNIDSHGIRFDWVGSRAGGVQRYSSVTLPYNVKFNDAFTKRFEKVRDLEGGATGWWAPGVDRKMTLSTDVVRLTMFDADTKERIRELAMYDGPVFVRTPNGSAFAANVNVSGFTDDYDSLVSAVSFDAEEIDLVDEFKINDESIG